MTESGAGTAMRVAAGLEADGWKVLREPRGAFPEILQGFSPDIVATRGDEHLVVEIRSPRTPSSESLETLAARLAQLPGWRLQVVWVPDVPHVASLDRLAEWLRLGEELSSEKPDASLLLAWPAVEGLLQRLAMRYEPEGPINTSELIEDLSTFGVLSDADQSLLKKVRRVRNFISHGREPVDIDTQEVRDLLRLGRSVLASLEGEAPTGVRAGSTS